MFSAKRLIRTIKEFRKRNKITQMTFAKQIGTSSSTFSKWESEKINFNPDLNQIVGIAKAMGITPSELLSQGKNTEDVSSENNDKKATKTVKKTQSKRTVKSSKMASESKETKVKKAISTKEAVKKGRKTSVKAAKASTAKTAAAPAKKETSKRKPGRPRTQPKA